MTFPKTSATIHTLKNGLKVILEADASAPVISTQVWVETGSIHENQFLGAGVSHLLEHMVFKGTKSFSGDELSQSVQAAGGQWNAYTTFDRTVYYIDGPAEGASHFLKVLLEMVFAPSFPIDEFEKEKDVIRREIDMGLDDPDSRSSRLLFDTAFADDNRSQPVIGHLELFNKISHADMVSYHQARYTTENTFVCLSGDFDKQEVLAYLENLTSEVERSFTMPVSPKVEPAQQGLRVAEGSFAVPAAKFTMAWQAPSLEHDDAPALDLLCSILGGGASSRLYQKVRNEQELCLHIGAWSYLPTKLPGVLAISAELEPSGIEALEKAVHEEIKNLLSSPLDQELEKAKRMSLSAQFRILTTASGRASDLASNWHEGRNLDFTSDYLERINAVKIADLRKVAEKWMTGERTLTRTTIYPEDFQKEKAVAEEKQSAVREIVEHTLSNGLKLQFCQDSRTPLISIQAAVKTGLVTESVVSAGLNALHANLLTKGTISRSAEEIADMIDSLGASISASSGNNTTLIGASCLKPDIETIVDIFADCLISPVFNSEVIEREKAIQVNAIQEAELDPASLAFKELRKAVFGEQGYGGNALGSEESVGNLDRMSLSIHHKAYFNASNMTISIFGDIDSEQAIALAETYLAKVPEGKKASFEAQMIESPSQKEILLDKQQAVLTIGYPGVSLFDSDRHALALINAWCSDMAGPLFTKIREELGLAYYVSSTMFHGFDTGFFGFYMGTSPDQLELASKELLGAIEQIANEGMSKEVMESVKTSWLAKQALSNQSNGAMARLCSVDVILGLGADHFMKTADLIKALTEEDIKRVAKRVFADQEPTIVTVKP